MTRKSTLGFLWVLAIGCSGAPSSLEGGLPADAAGVATGTPSAPTTTMTPPSLVATGGGTAAPTATATAPTGTATTPPPIVTTTTPGVAGSSSAGGASNEGVAGATQQPVGAGGATLGEGGATTVGEGGAGGTVLTAPDNPLAHLTASAEQVGLLLANRFSRQTLSFSSVADLPGDGYKSACEWYGALGVASLTDDQALLDTLVAKFAPLEADFVPSMTGGEAHVDRYIFGMVPLEIYIQTGHEQYLPLGTDTADQQQVTNQTRDAIDDMFMMTVLQLEAYRATGDTKYLDFMASTMVDYLGAQQSNGLFFHNVTQARTHWGRGNGWFAAGMAEIMRDLPEGSSNYQTIEAGYQRMMEGLLPLQSDNGLWYQVLDMPDDPNNWEETSGSAMFTYAMVAGVRRGVLNADTYVPVIEAAWAGLQSKISPQGDVSDICIGTWYQADARGYMGLSRLTGDGHGQAPVLWTAAELLR